MEKPLKIYTVICEPKPVPFFEDAVNEELFFAPFYEHTFRKFKDAINKLNIDASFVRVSTIGLSNALSKVEHNVDDIVIFASPLAFLASGKDIEEAIEQVYNDKFAYVAIGSMLDLYAVVGSGKILSDTDILSPSDFIARIDGSSAKFMYKNLADGERATPASMLDYIRKVEKYREEFLDYLVMSGVEIQLRDGIIIAPNTEIRKGTKIFPGTQIRGMVRIHEKCVIGPNSIIENSEIGEECVVNSTQIYSSILEKNVKIGPFCHVRPNSHLLSGVQVGDFVEIKNSIIGNDTHASHLTYIGDSDVGARVNFGCGVVTVNYDGKNKYRCKIGDDAFIGCNTNLIAPLNVGKGAFTAAGSTITDDVPAGALAIAREYQTNHEGWASKRRKK